MRGGAWCVLDPTHYTHYTHYTPCTHQTCMLAVLGAYLTASINQLAWLSPAIYSCVCVCGGGGVGLGGAGAVGRGVVMVVGR